MTPLIQRMARLTPEPEKAMWFDLGPTVRVEAQRVPLALLLNLPFPNTAICGTDKDGLDFSVWLLGGENSVTVSGVAATNPVRYWPSFAYVKTDDGLRYYSKGKEIPQEAIRSAFRMVAACLLKLQEATQGYKPTPQNTFINRKRSAKGKPAISFDWHTVKIEPPAIRREHQGGTHASPRLHDRRGHWRNHKSGKRVWVRSCQVGNAARGAVFKDYQV